MSIPFSADGLSGGARDFLVEILETLIISPASFLSTIVGDASSAPNESFNNTSRSAAELVTALAPPPQLTPLPQLTPPPQLSLPETPKFSAAKHVERMEIQGIDPIKIKQRKSNTSQEPEESIEAIRAFVTGNESDESDTASLSPAPGGIQNRFLPNPFFTLSGPAPLHPELSPKSCLHLAAVVDSAPATDLLRAPVVGSGVDQRDDPSAEEVGHCILA